MADSDPAVCEHAELSVLPSAVRLAEPLFPGDRLVTIGWHLTVDVVCAACGQPFRWVGVPVGVFERKPGTSLTGARLFAPLALVPQRPDLQ